MSRTTLLTSALLAGAHAISCDTPVYVSIEVHNQWTAARHPTEFPTAVWPGDANGAHISPPVVVSHAAGYGLYATGSLATAGVALTATTGSRADILPEITACQSAGNCLDYAVGSTAAAIRGADQKQAVSIQVDKTRSKISAVHMLAPSPDWFTGIKDVELCGTDNEWADVTVEANPYDAGVDSNASFVHTDAATSPVEAISLLTSPFNTANSVATYRITILPITNYVLSCDVATTVTIEVHNVWTAARHPTDFPTAVWPGDANGAHISPPVVVSHAAGYPLYATGSLATTGVAQTATTGSRETIVPEITDCQTAGNCFDYAVGSTNATIRGADQKQSLTININSTYSRLSAVHMLAPSPDWFTGISDIELCQGNKWTSQIIEANPYDAGVDDATTFVHTNAPSSPATTIARLATPFDSSLGVAIYTITINEPPKSNSNRLKGWELGLAIGIPTGVFVLGLVCLCLLKGPLK